MQHIIIEFVRQAIKFNDGYRIFWTRSPCVAAKMSPVPLAISWSDKFSKYTEQKLFIANRSQRS